MKRSIFKVWAIAVAGAVTGLLAAASGPAFAVPGGEIGTLAKGKYICELPGVATGPAGIHVAEADFTVISASSYRAHGRIGSYLFTGDRVIMTSGTLKGHRFRRISEGFLRELEPDGNEGKLRCILVSSHNA